MVKQLYFILTPPASSGSSQASMLSPSNLMKKLKEEFTQCCSSQEQWIIDFSILQRTHQVTQEQVQMFSQTIHEKDTPIPIKAYFFCFNQPLKQDDVTLITFENSQVPVVNQHGVTTTATSTEFLISHVDQVDKSFINIFLTNIQIIKEKFSFKIDGLMFTIGESDPDGAEFVVSFGIARKDSKEMGFIIDIEYRPALQCSSDADEIIEEFVKRSLLGQYWPYMAKYSIKQNDPLFANKMLPTLFEDRHTAVLYLKLTESWFKTAATPAQPTPASAPATAAGTNTSTGAATQPRTMKPN